MASYPRPPAPSRVSHSERVTRVEEGLGYLKHEMGAWKDDFKSHAREVAIALRELRDEQQQKKGAERRNTAWTGVIVAVVTAVVNVVIKLIS